MQSFMKLLLISLRDAEFDDEIFNFNLPQSNSKSAIDVNFFTETMYYYCNCFLQIFTNIYAPNDSIYNSDAHFFEQ